MSKTLLNQELPIPFNRSYMTGNELKYIAKSHAEGRLAGDGPFTLLCHQWLEKRTSCLKALLTHSCTAALEMSALLLGIKPGDEIIMPSYTFVSTANAFVLRGGTPVFVDIREDTLNINETLIEAVITPHTRAIVVVHYAGVACEMDAILAIARRYGLNVIEDAAQGIMSKYKSRPLGSLGDMGAFSFHETKPLICGEGGSLLINQSNLINQAEIIRDKGTDRRNYFRGIVPAYRWQDLGSSFLPGELIAAFLWAQFEKADQILKERLHLWQHYHQLLSSMENKGWLRRPNIPSNCEHNAHMYYVILDSYFSRDEVLSNLKEQGVHAVFHYLPLHSSKAGLRFGRADNDLHITDYTSKQLIRLPLWIGLTELQQDHVIGSLNRALQDKGKVRYSGCK